MELRHGASVARPHPPPLPHPPFPRPLPSLPSPLCVPPLPSPLSFLLLDHLSGLPPHPPPSPTSSSLRLCRFSHIEISIQLLPSKLLQLHAFSSLSVADPSGERDGGGADLAANVSSPDHESGFDGSALQRDAIFFCRNCTAKVTRNSIRDFVQLPCVEWREVVEHWFGTCCCSFGSKAEFLSVCYEKSLCLRPGRCLVDLSTFLLDVEDVIQDTFVESASLKAGANNEAQQSKSNFLSFGNGFMVWASEQNKYTHWVPLHCANCLTLIGAYPSMDKGSNAVVQGLHLFRCQILTSNVDGSPSITDRHLLFERVIAKELQARTEENAAFRFLIRSLSSKLPLLQLVVLSYEANICTGHCMEIAGSSAVETPKCKSGSESFGVVGDNKYLKPSVKLMFLDCSGLTADEKRLSELWGQERDAECIYMIEELAESLKKELLANSFFFPCSSGSFQNFQVSFLHV